MSRGPDPFEDLERLVERTRREFERVEDRIEARIEAGLGDGGPPIPTPSRVGAGQIGRVDLADDGTAYVVTVDLPGFERDDVDVDLREQRLTIRADREDRVDEAEPTDGDDARYVRRERRRRSVDRTVHLPGPVVPAEATASLHNGVLTVRLPTRDRGDPSGHEIDVE
jgi:HSP20 family protein